MNVPLVEEPRARRRAAVAGASPCGQAPAQGARQQRGGPHPAAAAQRRSGRRAPLGGASHSGARAAGEGRLEEPRRLHQWWIAALRVLAAALLCDGPRHLPVVPLGLAVKADPRRRARRALVADHLLAAPALREAAPHPLSCRPGPLLLARVGGAVVVLGPCRLWGWLRRGDGDVAAALLVPAAPRLLLLRPTLLPVRIYVSRHAIEMQVRRHRPRRGCDRTGRSVTAPFVTALAAEILLVSGPELLPLVDVEAAVILRTCTRRAGGGRRGRRGRVWAASQLVLAAPLPPRPRPLLLRVAGPRAAVERQQDGLAAPVSVLAAPRLLAKRPALLPVVVAGGAVERRRGGGGRGGGQARAVLVLAAVLHLRQRPAHLPIVEASVAVERL
mmetsp:Transcript_38694/g.110724  ORF Transcript_38694/g.110724 Transcript_38694/m.110724 type:complete len:387 (+) Transcript_38694:347-1507(+)